MRDTRGGSVGPRLGGDEQEMGILRKIGNCGRGTEVGIIRFLLDFIGSQC